MHIPVAFSLEQLYWQIASFPPPPCLSYSLTLKIEVTCSSEMLVDFQQTTQRYIPEDRILHNEILLNEYDLSPAHCYTNVSLCV
jgi:hypothetical protein